MVSEENILNSTDADITINLGCTLKIKGLQMKNIKKEFGGTREFSVSTSESPEGPWTEVLSASFSQPESSACSPMETFDIS